MKLVSTISQKESSYINIKAKRKHLQFSTAIKNKLHEYLLHVKYLLNTYYEVFVSHINILVEWNTVDRGRQRFQVQSEEF